MMNNLTLQENLNIINEFLSSNKYMELVSCSKHDNLIQSFVHDLNLHYETIKFFINSVNDSTRATLESNHLVDKILLYSEFDK